MAQRLKTRLSAGAALVTGLGMVGIATAVPAHADSNDLVYECTTPLGAFNFDITLSATETEEAAVGDTVTLAPSGTLTVPSEVANGMAGALGWNYVDGDANGVEATVSNGTDTATATTDLAIERTHIWTGSAWIQDDTPELPLSGTGGDVEATAVGDYTITAPETFSATFRGYDADEAQVGDAIESDCTYVEGERLIDTITVTEDGPEEPEEPEVPEVDDWFDEPASLPLVNNTFTVEGEATRAGTMLVQVLDGTEGEEGETVPGDVLTTYTWEVPEGTASSDFELVEGADFVRLLSQDCVDADGNTEEVVGSGCNVTYTAPWVNGDGDDDMDGDDQSTDDEGDDQATGDDPAQPEVPQVVQTDGFTASAPQEDNTAALALGGLLFAGAAAGTIVVARRRAAAQR